MASVSIEGCLSIGKPKAWRWASPQVESNAQALHMNPNLFRVALNLKATVRSLFSFEIADRGLEVAKDIET